MNLQHRIDLLARLGQYILSGNAEWTAIKEKAGYENGWFTPGFVDLATNNIALSFLQKEKLQAWTATYPLETSSPEGPGFRPLTIGIVMAGNIPLVGFHDFLSVFLSGHKALIKPSSKDRVLINHIAEKLGEWDAEVNSRVAFSEMLKACDAYIATGSNNSSRYFDYYFKKYSHLIRRNRTSIGILTGEESMAELEKLADDVYTYFGLGCRNVTKIFVPRDYDFVPLLEAFRKYNYLAEHHKYKNNYDYNLALHLLNKKYYMTNDSILLVEEAGVFSPISQLNYEFYTGQQELNAKLPPQQDLQCIAGKNFMPFGQALAPSLNDYADGVDTLRFLSSLQIKVENQ
ncbi:MAG: acyl-CoA reductase [Ferruginibacter sp.]|nr:acyl-CoA reductase [Chitinophagaceae bacterium]